jgi:hypothetical protein
LIASENVTSRLPGQSTTRTCAYRDGNSAYVGPADEVLAWCSAMLATDRVGLIAREPLEALRRRAQPAKAQ